MYSLRCLFTIGLLLVFSRFGQAEWTPPLVRRDGVMPERRQECDPSSSSVNQDKVDFPMLTWNPNLTSPPSDHHRRLQCKPTKRFLDML